MRNEGWEKGKVVKQGVVWHLYNLNLFQIFQFFIFTETTQTAAPRA